MVCVQGRAAEVNDVGDVAPGPGAYDADAGRAEHGPAFTMPRAPREVAGGDADAATGAIICVLTHSESLKLQGRTEHNCTRQELKTAH